VDGLTACKTKGAALRRPFQSDRSRLQSLYVLGLETFRSIGHGELHLLAFLQAAETTSLDRRKMHEDIFAILPADKTIALRVVKPLHCSLFHL
jgi:hypothetical protein